MSKSVKLAALAAAAALSSPAFAQSSGADAEQRVVTAPHQAGGSSASIVGASRPGHGPVASQRTAPRNEAARNQNGASTSANASGAQPR